MTATGIAMGVVLGTVGSMMSLRTRVAFATLVALTSVVIGILEALGVRVRLPEPHGQTPRRWLDQGSFVGPAKNGIALGFGLATKVGFSMWYLIPIGALLTGSALGGGVVYGAYAFVRGLGVWGIMLAIRIASKTRPPEEVQPGDWLTGRYRATRLSLSTALVSLGLTGVVAVGF